MDALTVKKHTAISLALLFANLCLMGVFAYFIAENAVYSDINKRLGEQAGYWRTMVNMYEDEISAQEKRVRRSAESIVSSQAKMTYELIDKILEDNGGSLTDEARQDLLNRLGRNAVGKTGYIWILDYQGNYILSKNRQRDGENIWDTRDSEGSPIIHRLVKLGREVDGPEIAYDSYPWLNIGENEPREKIAAMLNFPELGWVVGISTYYDDLVDMYYRTRTIEHVKNLLAEQKIGKSGYIWVVDSKGVYQVSKNRLRDGEDISGFRDSSGRLFIQDAVIKAKAAGLGTDIISYPWTNKGEKSPRTKVAGLAYAGAWDWTIGTSAYYDDLAQTGPIASAKKYLIMITILIFLFDLAIIAMVGRKLSRSLGVRTVKIPDA